MSRIIPEGLHQYSLSIHLSVSLSSAPFPRLTICHDQLVLLFGVIFGISSNTRELLPLLEGSCVQLSDYYGV